MALDALKLRNIIQLVGILGAQLLRTTALTVLTQLPLAFHVALIVFSALQVHEARDALVFSTEVPCTTFVVCNPFHSHSKLLRLNTFR